MSTAVQADVLITAIIPFVRASPDAAAAAAELLLMMMAVISENCSTADLFYLYLANVYLQVKW